MRIYKYGLTMIAVGFVPYVFAGPINIEAVWPENTLPIFEKQHKRQFNELSAVTPMQFIWRYPSSTAKPAEALDEVSSGRTLVKMSLPPYNLHKMGMSHLFYGGAPFLNGPWTGFMYATQTDASSRLNQQFADKNYAVHAVWPCGGMPAETFWSSRPLQRPEDFQGMNVRSIGLASKVYEKMGANLKYLPGGKLVEAKQAGEVDAVEFNTPAVDQFLGLQKEFKYNYGPAWHQPSEFMYLLFNKPFWESLSQPQQRAIENTCNNITVAMISELSTLSAEAINSFSQQGVILSKWPQPVEDAARQAWSQVAAELSAEDPKFKENYEHVMSFQKKLSLYANPQT